MYLGASSGQRKYQQFDLPAGAAGVRATLKVMSRLVREYKRHPLIRERATAIIQHVEQKDWSGEVRALHAFVRDNIRFTRDINGIETIHSPEVVLQIEHGDCDDKSTLLATLLESTGHPTRFIACGMVPGHYSHVYVETRVGPRWIALETTEDRAPGWAPSSMSRMTQNN